MSAKLPVMRTSSLYAPVLWIPTLVENNPCCSDDSSRTTPSPSSFSSCIDAVAETPFVRHLVSFRLSFSLISSFPSSLVTSRRYIQQHRDQLLSTHGSFLTRHQSIADKDLASKAPTGMHQVVSALPAADLFRTKVHEGLGTSEKDPYDRTLPNMESIPPATTVLYSTSIQAPNEEEKEQLERRWHHLRVWWDGDYPRMPLFLEKQKLSNVPLVSSTVDEMLLEFRDTVLPSLSPHPEEVAKLQEWWASAQETYKRCGLQFVLNKSCFIRELQRTHDHVMRSVSDSTGKEQFSVALEVLRRKAMAEHNAILLDYYHPIAHRETGLPRPTANEMWELFLTNVQAHKSKIFVKTTDGPLWYAWEALLVEQHLRPPSMTAPVALLFALVTLQLKAQQASASTAGGEGSFSSTPCVNDGHTNESTMPHVEKDKDASFGDVAEFSNSTFSPTVCMRRYHRYVSILTRRRFVLEALMKLFLSTPVEVDVLAKKFHSEGELETARDLSLCAAMLTNTELLHAEAASVVAPFSSTSEVKSVFASIYAGKDEEAKNHLCTTLGISPSNSTGTGNSSNSSSNSSNFKRRQINWDEVMEKADWKNQWKSLVTALLIHPPFLHTVHTYIKNAIGAKGVERELFHPNVAEQLDRIKQARIVREASCKRSTDALILKLSSYEWVDRTLRFLLEMESSAASTSRNAALWKDRQNILEPEAMAAEHEEASKRSRDTPVTAQALASVFEAIQLRHPQWVKSGVLPSLSFPMEENNESHPTRSSSDGTTQASDATKVVQYFLADPFAGLRVLTRIFIRLAYVPQAGAAMIAQRTRRRIGPVGLKPTEFNIPAECGIVEQFDNLLYKRYDWQGWYQRMVDIHNRNVSLRCRLDDLRKLDAYGNPFVDLQTERRLRILCGERVGMSVLKLDSDKYEDQKDNITYGVTKLSEILAESRKAQLGMEYWPTVEVKVRRPSGQSQAYYSVLDEERIEKESKSLYESYKEQKKRSLFVTPMNLWLKTKGTQSHKKTDLTDEKGYSVASLHASLNEEDSDSTPS